jgi:signal transduction histidine kinase/ligand-binding sensor domain-containing protein
MQRNLLFLACFFIYGNCPAQLTDPIAIGPGGQYPFVHYTPKDGLVNSRVRKANQDSKGRMYFITYGGLSVYDGARFKNYTTQNGLISGLVNDVLEVGDDSLLVAVNTCGLNVLVRGQMKKINITGNHCPVVNDFLQSHDGTIYAAADDGLYKLNETRFEKLPAYFPGQKKMIMYIGAIAEYKDFLVFGTNDLKNHKGLFLYDKKNNSITDAWPEEPIFSLQSDRNGIIWVSTYFSKIGNLDTAALSAGKLLLKNPYDPYINAEKLVSGSIVFNRRNEPIIFSHSKGIIRYRKDGTVLPIAPPETSGFFGQSFFSDREDVLWICHDGNGVYKLANTKLRSAVSQFDESKSGVKTVRSNTADTCWIVTNNNKLSLYTLSGRRNFTFTPSFTINVMFYSGNYLYAADLNKFYFASMPAENESTIRFTQILSLPDSSGFGEQFVTDPHGNIIFHESGNIGVLQKDKLLFKYPVYSLDLIEGMFIDKNDRLWTVSRGGGLQVFSIHPENPAQYLQKKQQFFFELESASPRCMTVDKNELFWIGTRYDGLMAFEYKNDQLIKRYHFRTENGLTDDYVIALTCDRNNNIVAGSQTGLDRLIKTKDNGYRIENVTKSNNVFSIIYDVWTDAADNVFALTNAGAVFQVEPVQNGPAGFEPKLLIEEMKVNGQSISLAAASLRLKHFQRNISFSVAAPTFIDERQVKYSYLLAGGGNKEWSDTVSNADINLLNLSPGNYTLRVKSFFPSTSYTPKEMDFSFIILPPWWQTWWFRIPGALLMIGLLIAGIRFYYRRKLEKQKIILEKRQAIEKERTRIATDMHDDLGAGLSRIKFLSETIGIKKQKHEKIEDELSSIRNYSHEMIDKMGEIVWALNEKNDSLVDLLAYVRAYTVEYLSQNGIGVQIKTDENVPDVFVSGEFRRNIYLTVKEALHNIVKHSQATRVTVDVKAVKGLFINIYDNGVGFDENNIRLFSNGITNMKKRITGLEGRIEIKKERGTAISLFVPLP